MLMPQPSFESPRVQGPKRVTAQGRRTGAAAAAGTAPAGVHGVHNIGGGKHVRFAETREGRAVKELLGGGGSRTPLGEKYVNRMVSAAGNPTSLSMEEAKLLASLRKLDAHCLAIPAAAAGLDFRGVGSALDGGGGSRTVDSLIDGGVSTSGAYSSRRSVEEAALLASLKRLDGRLGGMKDQMVAMGQQALAQQHAERAGVAGAGKGNGNSFLGPPPPALMHHPPAPQRQPRSTAVTDAWGAPPIKEGATATAAAAAGRYGGGVVTGMKKRHERKQVGYTRPDGATAAGAGGGGAGEMMFSAGAGVGAAGGTHGGMPMPMHVHSRGKQSALTPSPMSGVTGGGGLRSAVAAGGGGGGEVLRARQHVRDSGGTIRGNIHDYF